MFVALAACLLLVAARVSAQRQASNDLNAPVEPGAKATDLDLIRMVLPDAVENDEGAAVAHKTIDLRDLFDHDEPGAYEADIKLESFVKLSLRDGVHKDWCYLLNLNSAGDDSPFTWGETHVLALFRLDPQPRLLDAAEVQADRFAELWSEHSVLEIGPQRDALIIANSHFNSSEGFLQLGVIAPEQDKLADIYDYGGVEHSNACGYNFAMSPTFTTIKQGRATHYPLRLRVKVELMADDEACEHRRRRRNVTRYYQAPLVWQAKQHKYVESGHGLDWVDRFENAYLNQP